MKTAYLERLWRWQDIWCVQIITDMASRCGYVLIEPDHPYHGKGYTEEVPDPYLYSDDDTPGHRVPVIGLFAAAMDGEDGMDGWSKTMEGRIKVHGGVTYSSHRSSEDWERFLVNGDGVPGGWWIGFDCMHADDKPDFESAKEVFKDHPKTLAAVLSFERIHNQFPIFHEGMVWSANEVQVETQHLAAQVAAVAVLKTMERVINEIEA